MVYASASRGFKSGGFQVGESGSFDPEFLWSYEAGVKSILFDQRLRANFGAFFYDFTDLQVVTFVNGVGQTDNAGEATLKGFEAEFLARPTDGLDFTLNIAYLDATYDTFTQVVNGVEFDLLYGPAYKGIPLASAVAIAGEFHIVDVAKRVEQYAILGGLYLIQPRLFCVALLL